MRDRRAFLKQCAGATAGMFAARTGFGDGFAPVQIGAAPGKRREVVIGGRRVKTVDIHAHTFVREVGDLVKDTPLAAAARGNLTGILALGNPQRLIDMDAQGIDVQVINVNAWGYAADRALARDVIALQNERISQYCAAHRDRFVGMAAVALQHPDLAADQLDHAVRKLGMQGAAIGGSVEGQELSDRKFDPFWAKAEELGAMLFMHPQPAQGTTQNIRLQGKGGLTNTIGNPLETTVFLSHLIFEGTLDRFPGLRICAAHAGGYLASYSGRSDALCGRGGGADCKALKRKPSEYFRSQLYIDTMIFHEEGLRHLVTEVGADHIFYGTDYPFDWPVEDCYIAELIACLGQISEGVTCGTDTSQSSHTAAHTDALIKGLQDSGRRMVFAYSPGTDRSAEGDPYEFPGAMNDTTKGIGRLADKYFSSKDQLVTLGFGGGAGSAFQGAPYTGWQLARSFGASLSNHVVGNPQGIITAAADARNGTDWSDVTFIHATRWQDNQVAAIGARSAGYPNSGQSKASQASSSFIRMPSPGTHVMLPEPPMLPTVSPLTTGS